MTTIREAAPRLAAAHAQVQRWGSHLPPAYAPDPRVQDGGWARDWSGYLTIENVQIVGAWLRGLLGSQHLAIVGAWEYSGWEPEVRGPDRIDLTGTRMVDEGEVLEAGISSSVSRPRLATPGREWAHVGFACGGWSYAFHSYLATQPRMMQRGLDQDGMWRLGQDAQYSAYLRWHRGVLTVRNQTPEGKGMWTAIRPLEHHGATVLDWEQAGKLHAALVAVEADWGDEGKDDDEQAALEHLERFVPQGWRS